MLGRGNQKRRRRSNRVTRLGGTTINTHGALPMSMELADMVLNDGQKSVLCGVLTKGRNTEGRYNLAELWRIDATLGGIGGYCLPADPTRNPFPGGEVRSLYRPLQYARTDMELLDLTYTARYVIQSVGMHLEAAARQLLTEHSLLERLISKPLGAAVNRLCDKKLLSYECCTKLKLVVPLVNISKHEVNQDGERDGSFVPVDALIVYLAGRILGLEILSHLRRTDIPMAPIEELLRIAEDWSPRQSEPSDSSVNSECVHQARTE